MEKIDKLQQLMKLLQNDTITPQEVEKFLIMVVEVVKKAKDSFERISSENLAQVSEFLEYMQSEHERILSRSQNAIDIAENTLDTFDLKLAEAKSLVAKLRIMEPKNGIDGKDADEEYIISEVLNRIQLPEPKEIELDTGEDIVEKINQLPTDEKYQIDASHIKNLPKFTGGNLGSTARNLWQLNDVTLTSPANDDVLKYNSTTGQWENGTGGGGGGTPGGSDTQLQYNNASAFGGITGATTNGTAVTYTTSNLIGADIKASSSAGFKILSNAGTPTALFGAGGGANSTFYGGSKLDYATASTIAILDGSKNLISADTATYPSLTELSYVKGVTSAIQTQLNGKAATLSGTTNEIAYFNSPSTIASLSTGTYPSLTELSYVKGVTSAIQTQINALANGMIYKGNWDASAGTFPGAGVAQVGWFYTVSVGGTVDSIVFEVGDRLIATTNNASTTVYAGNWTKLDATDAVTSVFGRVGNVVSANGDYTASQITNVPAGSIAATTVQAAIDELDTDKQPTGNYITALTGDITASGPGSATATIAAGAVDIAMLSATGTPSGSTYLRGDNTWATVSTGGDVSKVGTPVDNQVGVWTGDGTIEGTSGLTYDGTNLLVTGSLGATGTRLTKGWFTDLEVTNAIVGSITGNAATVTNAALTTALTVNTGTVTLSGNVANTSVLTIGAGAVSVSGTNTGDQTSVSGNAGTATALQTARTIGGVSFDGTANITVATATGGFTISGGNLALGANSITMSGSIGATGTRVTKGWFTDLEVTNDIAGSITGNAATVTNGVYTTGAGTVYQTPTGTPAGFIIASQAVGDLLYASSTTAWSRLGAGTNGHVLTLSSGVPTWAAPSGGSGWNLTQQAWRTDSATSYSPADATTYYLYPSQGATPWATATGVKSRLYIPKSGTIKAVYGTIGVAGTTSSGEDSTIAIRLNDTTSTNVSTTVETSAAINNFDNSSMSIAVSAGDFIEVLFTTPTWTTNPTNVSIVASIYIE